jgi:putative transposase
MNPLKYKESYRRNLPHRQPPGVTLFVTFRLADSLPSHIQEQLTAEAIQAEKLLNQITNSVERKAQTYLEQRKQFGRWDAALDHSRSGPFWLNDPSITQIVVTALHYLDNKVYNLDTFCIMANHVHLLFTPLETEKANYHALPAIMHSLKRHTAFESNKVLERTGAFWHQENYDHVVRDTEELNRIRQYILNNPVKAGLVDSYDKWPWHYCKYL